MAIVVKNPPFNVGDLRDMGLVSGLGRSPGGGHGNPLQYSCLENPMDRGAWRATVHSVAKSWTQLKWLSMDPLSFLSFLGIFNVSWQEGMSWTGKIPYLLNLNWEYWASEDEVKSRAGERSIKDHNQMGDLNKQKLWNILEGEEIIC